jgi:hypothetical protein
MLNFMLHVCGIKETFCGMVEKITIFFFTCSILMILRFFYSPTDAQLNCLKNIFKIYIKIDIKTAPIRFGVITIMRERTIRSW